MESIIVDKDLNPVKLELRGWLCRQLALEKHSNLQVTVVHGSKRDEKALYYHARGSLTVSQFV